MKRFARILCVIDANKSADNILERAVTLAKNNQASLTVISVAPNMTFNIAMSEGASIPVELQEIVNSGKQQFLDNAVERFQTQCSIQTKLLVGTPFLEIIREVLRNNHDLVILAPEEPTWLGRLFGSDDMHLLRKCPCPVWFVKNTENRPYKRILAAIDVDTDHPEHELPIRHGLNLQILELAVSLALSEFAELHVAHAWQAIAEGAMRDGFLLRPEEEVNNYVEQLRQQHETGLNNLLNDVMKAQGEEALQFLVPKQHLIKEIPTKGIPALAKNLDIDLVVMGTVSRTGVPGFLIGNTAESILGQIECSVLAVKPDGFKTPVFLDELEK